MIRREIEMMSKYDIIIADRSCIDAIGYTKALGFFDLAEAMLDIARIHATAYKKIFFRLRKNNPYNYDDGLRDTDDGFRRDVEDAIYKTLESLKLDRITTII